MSFNPQDIRKIGFLARIKIDDSELEPLADELSGIIEWVEQLNEVDTAGIQPMTSVTKMLLPQRQETDTVQTVIPCQFEVFKLHFGPCLNP